MAIRFQCNSCAQPIEVDDEWATKLVACPYCRKTVTAPSESTLPEPPQVPLATPVEETPYASQPMMPPAQVSAGSANPVAVAALALGVVTMVAAIMYINILKSHRLELMDIIGEAETIGDQLSAMNNYIAAKGALPQWFFALGAVQIVAVVFWLATLICGIIGLRKPFRRSWAVIGLLLAGIALILFCCGGALVIGPLSG